MKKILLASLILIFIFSCNNSGEGKKGDCCSFPMPTRLTLSVVYATSDSTGTVIPAERIIQPAFRADTILQRLFAVTDTQWFRRYEVKDSTGKTKGFDYAPLGKDSVYWDIANKNLDSLLRSFKVKKLLP